MTFSSEHEDRVTDVAGWALTALPRMPARVRATAAAWSLAFAAESRSGYAVVLGGPPPAGAMVLDPAAPSAPLLVARHGDTLVLGRRGR